LKNNKKVLTPEQKSFRMAEKRSIADGISCMASLGATMAGEVTGVEIDTCSPAEQQLINDWDDNEEMRYREWIREQIQDRPDANFQEYDAEAATRQMHKDLTKQNADTPVDWEDELEKQYRAKYIEMRTAEKVNWDNTEGERAAQLRSRANTEKRSKQEFSWDDTDERACMDKYRKKYSKS